MAEKCKCNSSQSIFNAFRDYKRSFPRINWKEFQPYLANRSKREHVDRPWQKPHFFSLGWTPHLPTFLTLRDEFVLDKRLSARGALHHYPNPLRRGMCPQERGLGKVLRDRLRWSRALLTPFISGVVVSFEVASFSLGRSSESHQHRRNCHPQPPGGSFFKEGAPHSWSRAWGRPGCTRDEEERKLLTHGFGHFQVISNFLKQGLHT